MYLKVVQRNARLASAVAHIDSPKTLFGADIKMYDEIGFLPEQLDRDSYAIENELEYTLDMRRLGTTGVSSYMKLDMLLKRER